MSHQPPFGEHCIDWDWEHVQSAYSFSRSTAPRAQDSSPPNEHGRTSRDGRPVTYKQRSLGRRFGTRGRNRAIRGRMDSSSDYRERSCTSTGGSCFDVGTSGGGISSRRRWSRSWSSTTSSAHIRATAQRGGHPRRSSGVPSVNNVTRRTEVPTPFRDWTL